MGEAPAVGLIGTKLLPGLGAAGLGAPIAGGGGGRDRVGGVAGDAAGADGVGVGLPVAGAVGAAPGPNTPCTQPDAMNSLLMCCAHWVGQTSYTEGMYAAFVLSSCLSMLGDDQALASLHTVRTICF